MAGRPIDNRSISLRAPDEFISGLLCIAAAGSFDRTAGALDTFPEQSGCWHLIGADGGSARLTYGDGCLLLESGQALAVSGECTVDVLFRTEGRLLVLCLEGRTAEELLRRSEALGGSVYPEGAKILREAIDALAEAEPVEAAAGSAIAYTALTRLYGTGTMAAKEKKELPQVVEAALRILQQDFAFLDGVGELADRLEVSQEYLTRTFRTHVGMTPGKYLNQIRVEHAKLLLQRGDHSVAFVADACGFANGNYFARVFRSMVGVTPSVYAREHAGHGPLPQSMLDSFYVL